MKNNKAFTLVELLAVITVMGIILLVAIPRLTNLTNKAKEDILEVQRGNFFEAGKAYFLETSADNKPQVLWETSKVSLQTLINKGYIDEVKNPTTNENCDFINSYIETGKGEDRNYIYNMYLKCGDYEYTNSNTKFKMSEYKIKAATKEYFAANGGEPTVDGEQNTVSILTLISENYIEISDFAEIPNSNAVGIIELDGAIYNYYSGFVSNNYLSLEGWNMLSDVGGFEVDTNEDGLADGWSMNKTPTFNLTTFKYVGNYAQEVIYENASGAAAWPGVWTIIDITGGHTYYASEYIRQFDLKGIPKLILHRLDSGNNFISQKSYGTEQLDSIDQYYQLNMIDTDTSGIAKYRMYCAVQTTAIETTHFGCDNAVLFDLTEMGLETKTTEQINQILINSGYEINGESVNIETENNSAPVLALIGDSTTSVIRGTTYTDAGAIATDTEDGNLTEDIFAINNVDTSELGAYTVTYYVNDSEGKAATPIVRTVNVIMPDSTFAECEDRMREAAELYYASNTGLLPSDGNAASVSYADLKTGNFLDPIYDITSENEILSTSKGVVQNNGGTYTYLSGIVSDNYISVEGWDLLYKISEMTTDTDSNGWADSFNSGSCTNQSVSNGYQTMTSNSADSPHYGQFDAYVAVAYTPVASHSYYMAAKVNPTGGARISISIHNYKSDDTYEGSYSERSAEENILLGKKLTASSVSATPHLLTRINIYNSSDIYSYVGTTETVAIDYIKVLDLTDMGISAKTEAEINTMILNSGY